MNKNEKLRHLIALGTVQSEDYTSPNQFPRVSFPDRNRRQHANSLLANIKSAVQDAEGRRSHLPLGAPTPGGIYLEFESSAGFDLTLKSLDLPREKIELLSVREIEEGEPKVKRTFATVFVPDEKISAFINRIEAYRKEDTTSGKPKNQALVASIEKIRLAVVQSLWTDLADAFPQPAEKIWWEVWLRATNDSIPRFQSFALARDITLSSRVLLFPDRHVMLAHTSADKLAASIDSLDFIAELRRAKETVVDFLDMRKSEQVEWIEALRGLLDPPPRDSLVISLLDTGINREHPLISSFLPQASLLTCDPNWGVDDREGHGTGMAGICLYDFLEDALSSPNRRQIPAHLESVKILPSSGNNPPELYGSLTEEAVSRATMLNPEADRMVCMAVTATDNRDRGQPSSWSAAVDRICAGLSVENKQHLVILSAGNSNSDRLQYPESNLLDGIHDPGQAWNALTVGAFTEKSDITEPSFKGWQPLADVGDISHSSTTSLTWERGKWPIKPDLVFEGGNAAINADKTQVDTPASLGLMTTNSNILTSYFRWFSDTSAASALAANMAAKISGSYPDFWPETLRAILIHSAEWSPAMRARYPKDLKTERESLLRTFGYGVPNLERALWSAGNSLTLIAQDSLQPFSKNSMKEMNIHELPWPVDELRSLGEAKVRMKVTLSYFIEPNPARRGWANKFRYQSHGLRFDVKTPEESLKEFTTRLNRERWDEERGRSSVTSRSDTDEWFFGKTIRSRGSLHSDFWEGTAASLADRPYIAVFPVVGWWRDRHKEGFTNKRARYSLVVTIETPTIESDIYTPVATKIANKIAIKT